MNLDSYDPHLDHPIFRLRQHLFANKRYGEAAICAIALDDEMTDVEVVNFVRDEIPCMDKEEAYAKAEEMLREEEAKQGRKIDGGRKHIRGRAAGQRDGSIEVTQIQSGPFPTGEDGERKLGDSDEGRQGVPRLGGSGQGDCPVRRIQKPEGDSERRTDRVAKVLASDGKSSTICLAPVGLVERDHRTGNQPDHLKENESMSDIEATEATEKPKRTRTVRPATAAAIEVDRCTREYEDCVAKRDNAMERVNKYNEKLEELSARLSAAKETLANLTTD